MSPYGHLGLVTGRFCWMLVHDGPDAIIYTDIGGLIRFWNSSAERLFGYSAREAIGRPPDFVIPESLENDVGRPKSKHRMRIVDVRIVNLFPFRCSGKTVGAF
jgi:PAS domain S-box-containing protein